MHKGPKSQEKSECRWKHVAVVRHSGTVTVYIDGSAIGSAGDTNSYDGDGDLITGGRRSGGNWGQFHPGWLDELRISKGIARWKGNFTPPDAPTPHPVVTGAKVVWGKMAGA